MLEDHYSQMERWETICFEVWVILITYMKKCRCT